VLPEQHEIDVEKSHRGRESEQETREHCGTYLDALSESVETFGGATCVVVHTEKVVDLRVRGFWV